MTEPSHIPYSEGYYEPGEPYSCYPNGPHRGGGGGGEGSPTSSVTGDSASLLAARAAPQIKPQAINLPKVLPTPERPHIGGPEGGGGVDFSHYPTSGSYGSYNYPPGGSLPRDYNKPRHAVPPSGFFPDYSATIRPNYTHGPRNASFQDYDYHGSYAAGIQPPSPPSANSPHRRSAAAVVVPKDHPDFNHHAASFEEAAAVMAAAAAASEYGATTPSPAATDRYAAAYVGYPPPPAAATSPGSHFEAGPQGYLDRRPSYDDRPPPHLLYGTRGDVVDGTARGEGRDVRWRDPDLHEVIDFLSHPNNVVQANAAAYLQHLSYMDDEVKQKTRVLGGISPLIELLNQDIPEIQRNACGALRNLSFGRQNEENKRAIRNAGGIPTIVRLLRKTPDNEIRELLTGVLWNLSSSEDLKKPIIDDALSVLVSHIIIPHSGWDHSEQPQDIYWSTVFRNASGVLRNISSAGEYARRRLRECEGLVDALLHLVRAAVGRNDMDNKSVENCVCTLRNLSYRCQEVEDPDYDRHASSQPFQSRAMLPIKVVGENLGCFGASRKKKEASSSHHGGGSSSLGEKARRTGSGEQIGNNTGAGGKPRQGSEPLRGMDLLWQPEVVQPYLSLLSECSNPETLEAAAGAIQNLAACYWQPSIDIRAAVRKEKGLPILVELLRMEVDRVVCAVATALRNLAMDQRNKELIGKYAMKDLVQKLPNGSPQHDAGTSDDTVAAVLATLNEVVVRNGDFARSLLEAGGVERLTYITKQKGKFSPRVVKFTSQLLFNLWQHQELREVYRKAGWKESHFLTRTLVASRGSGGALSPATSANNTLSRPISSQGTTHYEDRTLRARELNPASAGNATTPNNPGTGVPYSRSEDLALNDLAHALDGTDPTHVAAVGNPPPTSMQSPNTSIEPVYAQVNREKKKNRQLQQATSGASTAPTQGVQQPPTTTTTAVGGGGDLSAIQPPPPLLHDTLAPGQDVSAATVIQAGDSWV